MIVVIFLHIPVLFGFVKYFKSLKKKHKMMQHINYQVQYTDTCAVPHKNNRPQY